jgi:hypothetical protein
MMEFRSVIRKSVRKPTSEPSETPTGQQCSKYSADEGERQIDKH